MMPWKTCWMKKLHNVNGKTGKGSGLRNKSGLSQKIFDSQGTISILSNAAPLWYTCLEESTTHQAAPAFDSGDHIAMASSDSCEGYYNGIDLFQHFVRLVFIVAACIAF